MARSRRHLTASEARVCLGEIGAPHGVRGQVRVRTFTEAPEQIAAYGPLTDEHGGGRFVLSITGHRKSGVIAAIEGVSDRNAAAALRGTRLCVARADLPEPEEDEFYYSDLMGLRAECEDGTVLGQVVAVHDFGAGDLIEIELRGDRTAMLPFTKEVVPEVDIARGRIVLRPPEGLVEESQR